MADATSAEEVKAEKVDTWLEKIPEGLRKFIVLAPPLWAMLIVGSAALFTGKMSETTFVEYVIGVLTWGGGIFAAANVLEHLAKAVLTRKGAA